MIERIRIIVDDDMRHCRVGKFFEIDGGVRERAGPPLTGYRSE